MSCVNKLASKFDLMGPYTQYHVSSNLIHSFLNVLSDNGSKYKDSFF